MRPTLIIKTGRHGKNHMALFLRQEGNGEFWPRISGGIGEGGGVMALGESFTCPTEPLLNPNIWLKKKYRKVMDVHTHKEALKIWKQWLVAIYLHQCPEGTGEGSLSSKGNTLHHKRKSSQLSLSSAGEAHRVFKDRGEEDIFQAICDQAKFLCGSEFVSRETFLGS